MNHDKSTPRTTMRKLPEGCPETISWGHIGMLPKHFGFHKVFSECSEIPLCRHLEVMPLGSRALQEELVDMVERLSEPCTIQDRHDAVTLLKRVKGEG